ncbi:MAG: DUF1934 family protein [Bacillota bacterium]|nr:DUF1934 family protein [Bacillota bacterium]
MSVKIKVKTSIFQETGEEIIELTACGHFYQKGQACFLQYDEEAEVGRIRTILKWAGEEVSILRSGAVKMRMPLVLNREIKGSYELPFGKLETASTMKEISHSYNAENGEGYIDLLYDFSMQGTHAGTYHLEISFQEEDSNEHSGASSKQIKTGN